MTALSIEEQIAELETRVDRLRALYEQYFMGIEKMEPHVPRKDVDRRIQQIRKEQIRNTALRFRFQMILQRYNTYQTYWIRVCREIEEGTYKRDVARARAKFGEAQLPKWHRKRYWKKGEGEEASPEQAAAAAGTNGAAHAHANGAAESSEEIMDVDFEEVDVGSFQEEEPTTRLMQAAKKPPPPPAAAMPKPAPPKPPPPNTASPLAAARNQAAVAAPPPRPIGAVAPPPSSKAGGEGATGGTKEDRMRELARRLSAKGATGAAPQSSPGATVAAAAAQRPPLARPETPASVPRPPLARPEMPASVPRPAPAPPAAPVAAPAAAPAPAPVPAPTPAAQKHPQSPARAPVAAAAAAAAPARPAGAQDLSEERMRQIYNELVDTKRKQKESTASVTFEAMRKTLAESQQKLREKHAGRSVDFEVTVKDGKTILRPVVK